jgi:hypothetical protein
MRRAHTHPHGERRGGGAGGSEPGGMAIGPGLCCGRLAIELIPVGRFADRLLLVPACSPAGDRSAMAGACRRSAPSGAVAERSRARHRATAAPIATVRRNDDANGRDHPPGAQAVRRRFGERPRLHPGDAERQTGCIVPLTKELTRRWAAVYNLACRGWPAGARRVHRHRPCLWEGLSAGVARRRWGLRSPPPMRDLQATGRMTGCGARCVECCRR